MTHPRFTTRNPGLEARGWPIQRTDKRAGIELARPARKLLPRPGETDEGWLRRLGRLWRGRDA